MKKILFLPFYIFLISLVAGVNVRAQIAPPPQDQGLEELYDRFEDQEVRQSEELRRDQAPKKEDEEASEEKKKEMSKVSDLSLLAPFQDIAIIQKRFLPKTKRFEISGAGVLNTNNAYFNNIGIAGRFAFYLQEKLGLEGTYIFLDSSERPITKGLKDDQNIKTESLVEPEGYYGVSLKWAPLYGKMAWLGEKIVPFDIYFAPGFGMTQTALGESHTTLSFAAGQIFALSKSSGIRWDLLWNFYQAETRQGTETSKSNHSDLILTLGYSFFFPEATYR